jgi:transposase InsO family protein
MVAGGRRFVWNFLLASVSFPIIGADFLKFHKLILNFATDTLQTVDAKWKCKLVHKQAKAHFSVVRPREQADQEWPVSSPVAAKQPPLGADSPPTAAVAQSQECGGGINAVGGQCINGQIKKLLMKYNSVFSGVSDLPAARHGVEHRIITEGRPVSARYRRLDAEKLRAAKVEFEELERAGIVRRSKSSWSSPLHMVKKSDGTWRPCGDYRRLNVQTLPDRYTCPNVADLSSRLAGCTVFTKLDLKKGYHQVPMHPDDVGKTAIITPFGLFEYLRMPFGLRNAGQTFQRLMDQVMRELDFCFTYLDDVLVASADMAAHESHLEEVLQRLQQAGLLLNGGKCVFAAASVQFLGHQVTAAGIAPLQEKVKAVMDFPAPKNNKQMMSFLGLVNFYRKFLPGAAKILKPLTDSLRGGQAAAVEWSAEMEEAFRAAKQLLCRATCLAHPDPHAELSLMVDASDTHIGAALQQASPRGPQPLAFFSRKLDEPQRRWSAFDRELLACHEAVRHFRWSLEGRVFYILTDHKPLTYALKRVSDAWSARQQRQLAAVAEYTTDIRHVAGADNVVADALSRPTVAVVQLEGTAAVDYADLAAEQQRCEATQQLAQSATLRIVRVMLHGHNVLCDISTGTPRPLVPRKWRPAVFHSLHDLAHPGVRATKRLVTSRYVWAQCAADVAKWCRSCLGCARGKPGGGCETPVQQIEIPQHRFSHIHVDIVGPFPTSAEGYTHLLSMVDRSTRWPEVVPLKQTDARSCADAFIAGWVSRFGAPEVITTDRGPQFTSDLWAAMCGSLQVRHVTTSAYHPQSNGLVERFHRQLKESLKARQCGASWWEHVP